MAQIEELNIKINRKKDLALRHVKDAIDYIKLGQDHILVARALCDNDNESNTGYKSSRLFKLWELTCSVLITDDRLQRESLQQIHNELNQELENGNYDI